MTSKVNKRKLSPRVQVVLVAVGLLLVAALGYFLLVAPKRSQAAELETELAAVEQQITDKRAKGLVEQPPPVAVGELFRLAKAMPDRPDMSGVILELNRVASDSGIVFESISPGGSTVVESYQVLPITLSFEGNFYSLSDFLFRLRNLVQVRDGKLTATGRLFTIESISFTQSPEQFPLLRADLTVNTYVFGTSTPASTPPPPPTTDGQTTGSTETTSTTPSGEQPAPNPSEPPAPPASAAPAQGASS